MYEQMLAGTPLENVALHPLDDPRYLTAMSESRESDASYVTVHSLRGADDTVITLPGVVVAELEEEMYDEELEMFLPTSLYWVISADAMRELSVSAGCALRLGPAIGWLDLAEAEGSWGESLEGFQALIAAGCVTNPEKVLEELELLDVEVEVLVEELVEERRRGH